jgi:nitrate reductase (NAD(P)H)
MDALVKGKADRCRLLYSLTKPSEGWQGLKGRVSKELLENEVGTCESQNGEELVLICGPETLEKSVHGFLNDMRWKDEDLLFF